MYGIAFTKLNDTNQHLPFFKTWQAEVRELYTHYFLIDLLLSQSTKLTDNARKSYQQQQKHLTKALERFIKELEESATYPYSTKQAIFNKHINTMQLLNKSVHDLVQKHQFSPIRN